MANFKACIRNQRADGFWPVYIRVTNQRKIGYIKTSKLIATKDLTNNKEIKDPFVLKYCSELIIRYNDKLNKVDATGWSATQVIEYVLKDSDDESYSKYAKLHIRRMYNRGQERNSKTYQLAVRKLELFLGTNDICFLN